MKRLLLLLAALSMTVVHGWSAPTAVTGTITGADGLPYANGTITVLLTNSAGISYDKLPYNPQTVNIPIQSFSAPLDSTGSFSIELAPNSLVTGSFWTFTGCNGGNTPACFSYLATITGAKQSLTTPLTAAALAALTLSTHATVAYVNNRPAVASVIVNAWGDSLTIGNQDGTGNSYPNYLAIQHSYPVFGYGVGGNTSAQILARYNLLNPLDGGFNSIWSGRNDTPAFTNTLANTQAITSQITGNNYVVLGVIPSDIETIGTTNYNAIIAYNQTLYAAYPDRWINALAVLLAAYNPANGVDLVDVANGVPPYTLRAVIATSTLPAAITTTATCAISTNTAFANGNVLSVESEYILETAGSGNNVTGCMRGYGGSTAATHLISTAYTVTDNLHLGAAGYQAIANAVAPFIHTANTPDMSSAVAAVLPSTAVNATSPIFSGLVVKSNPPTIVTATPTLTGGTLTDGTYFYMVCAADGQGGNSCAPEVSATVTGGGGTGKVTLAWTASTSTGVFIQAFKGTATGAENKKQDVFSGTSVVDTGSNFTSSMVPSPNPAFFGYFSPTLGLIKFIAPTSFISAVTAPTLGLTTTVAAACAVGIRGQFQYTAGGAGVKDIVEVCTKDAADAYAWRSIY